MRRGRAAGGRGRALALAGTLVGALLAAAPAWAGSWSFTTTEPLLLGVSVAGSFSGSDANADLVLEADELSAFSVAYTGNPPTTSSFSIVKSMLDPATDSFSFDLASDSLGFAVVDASGRSISGGTDSVTTVFGTGSDVDLGGPLTVSPVPEPATLPLVLLGGAVVWAATVQRKRRG